MRTVQLWFQENDKGASPENIRWLARIFGCGDPDAASAWQMELLASQRRLARKRKAGRHGQSEARELPTNTSTEDEPVADGGDVVSRGRGLSGWSEGLFVFGGPLNLPAAIFAGATALQFVSYFIGNHSITYVRDDGVEKQVGFHWATNWSFLFMLLLPLFVIFATDLIAFWRRQGREAIVAETGPSVAAEGWMNKVQGSSTTFWAVLAVCLGFAGLVQWVGGRLLPLRTGRADDAIDWASIALVRPEVVSVSEAIIFSGLAYLYMAVCFYVMFVGLILLFTLADDFRAVLSDSHVDDDVRDDVAHVILKGLHRCAVAGMLIAICMTVQNRYLSSDAPHVWSWLFEDLRAVAWTASRGPGGDYGFSMHYTSLIVALPTCIVMIYGIVRVGLMSETVELWSRMGAALAVIVCSYLLTGSFEGFAALLAIGVLLAFYGLFDPAYGARAVARRGRAK